MNFSKKNHEHKKVILKNVSKKIILGIVFVFASFTMVNANTSTNTSELKSGDCTADAWEFGTGWGGGDPYWEWYWTDRYFEYFCNDDGTYK